VQDDPIGREVRGYRHGQLALGADVETQPLLVHHAGDRAGQQRLTRVGNVLVVERVAVGRTVGAELRGVQDVGRRAVLRRDPDQAGPAH
jgi:hypothetical protein